MSRSKGKASSAVLTDTDDEERDTNAMLGKAGPSRTNSRSKPASSRGASARSPTLSQASTTGGDDSIPNFADISKAAGKAFSSASSPAPAATGRARPKPKAKPAASKAEPAPEPLKKVLTKQEMEELARLREKEAQEDDFFTGKRQIVFRGKGVAKRVPIRASSAAAATSGNKGKRPSQNIVINLDQSDSSSGEASPSDTESDGSVDAKGHKKAKKKKKASKSPPKPSSPVKRVFTSSSSSEESDDSGLDSDSSAWRRKKRRKEEKRANDARRHTPSSRQGSNAAVSTRDKGKGKARAGAAELDVPKERSLSPIAPIDTYAMAYAVQDIRRAKAPVRATHVIDSDGEDLSFLGDETLQVIAETDLGNINDRDGDGRSRSTSTHANGGISLSLLPDDLLHKRDLTEEEKELKYGPLVSIQVAMVHDPRVAITEQNSRGVARYTQPMDIQIRSGENFEKLFGRISTEKGIERSNIVVTYNNTQLYSFGTPASLHILSRATFLAYSRELWEHVTATREAKRQREVEEGRIRQLEEAARGNMLGARQDKAIDIEDDDGAGRGPLSRASTAEGSEIEFVSAPLAGGPSDVADDRNSRSVSLSHDFQESAASRTTTASVDAGPKVRLTIRGGAKEQVQIAVPTSKTIAFLVRYYLRKLGRTAKDDGLVARCRMLFDGEELSHTTVLEDTDLEDEDTIDIKVPAA